jgi:N-acetylglucosamine kinase-like BadF-type ATPase
MKTAVQNPNAYNVGDRARAAQAALRAKREANAKPKRYEQTQQLTAHEALKQAHEILQEAQQKIDLLPEALGKIVYHGSSLNALDIGDIPSGSYLGKGLLQSAELAKGIHFHKQY